MDSYLQYGALGILAIVVLELMRNVATKLGEISKRLEKSNVIQARILDRLEQFEKDLDKVAMKLSHAPPGE